jgi:phosphoenolpyruvate phosphomutase
MAVSSRLALPEKDFKAVLDGEGRIGKIGIEFFESAVAAQPLYKLRAADWQVWQESIHRFVQAGQKNCYAENAFNEVAGGCELYACDIRDMFCREIDTMEDLTEVRKERSLWRDR